MDLKKLYGEAETMTPEELQGAIEKAGLKIADLSTGQYVAKEKYETAIEAYKAQVAEYDAKIKTFEGLNPDELKSAIEGLEADKKALEEKLIAQEYSFKLDAVVAAEEFTSNAARKQFIQELHNKGLAFEGNNLLGYAEFKAAYAESDPGAFAVESAAGDKDDKPVFSTGKSKTKPAAMTSEDFNKLTTTEQLALKATDPELFIRLLKRR